MWHDGFQNTEMAQRNHRLRPLRPAFNHDDERDMRARSRAFPDNPLPKRHRVGVLVACNACREKKTRCDGQRPCRRCGQAGRICEYTDNSKRAIINTLQVRVDLLDRDSRAIKKEVVPYPTPEDAQDADVPPSERDNKSDRDDSESMKATPRANTSPSRSATLQREGEPVGPGPFRQLFSWKSTLQSLEGSARPTEILESDLSLPPLPIDAYTSHVTSDTWTRTGWTKAHIRHLFDALFTWEYLPVSLLYHNEFLQDFYNDSNRFCSSALVYAMLAIASRVINENNDDSRLLPSGWFGSRVFFDEAEAVLDKSGRVDSLPDIQAIGFLSLYCVRCGREEEAQQLAGDFVSSITTLCQRESAGEDELYSRIRTTTYCGAVSLSRMIHLTTGVLFNVPSNTLQGQLSILGDLSIISEGMKQASNMSVHNLNATVHSLRQSNVHLITAEMCRLTEFVYHAVTSARSEPRVAQHQVLAIYTKCLDWYRRAFDLINHDGPRTPFVLFVHMYYHFCLLCAFRPVLNTAPGDSAARPEQICAEAAQSILTLAQSYEDIFTLRRVPALLPYFVCAAGLFGLSLKKNGTATMPVHLRQAQRLHPEARPELDAMGPSSSACSASDDSSLVKTSAAAHARLLLAKMASTNPAIVAAEEMLFERT